MNGKKHSLWSSYVLSAAIAFIALLIVAWYAADRFHEFFIDHLQDTLKSRAITVSQSIDDSGMADKTCHVLKHSDPTIRVTVIDTKGVVQCDSEIDGSMENHARRPEISGALAGESGSITRFSTTLKTSMLYVAIPRHESGEIIGVIRTAMPLFSIEGLFDELHQQFLAECQSVGVDDRLPAACTHHTHNFNKFRMH